MVEQVIRIPRDHYPQTAGASPHETNETNASNEMQNTPPFP